MSHIIGSSSVSPATFNAMLPGERQRFVRGILAYMQGLQITLHPMCVVSDGNIYLTYSDAKGEKEGYLIVSSFIDGMLVAYGFNENGERSASFPTPEERAEINRFARTVW